MDARFDPRNPPPTSFETGSRTRRLVVFVAGIGFILAGVDRVVEPWPMLAVWWVTGILVATATIRIENYMLTRRRFGP